jgi:hypothetical protein
MGNFKAKQNYWMVFYSLLVVFVCFPDLYMFLGG